jgi:16S rRNA (adenine1518-N6/adenine1519-N6)-dimethyltransferase
MSNATTTVPGAPALLQRYGLQAKRSWGQNFLISERIYRAMVDAIVTSSDDFVVEFGAGLGTLTLRIAARVPDGKVFAVERDRDLVPVLRAELAPHHNVKIVAANALTYDLAAAFHERGRPIVLCGNLPYQIATRLLMRALSLPGKVCRAVFMVQREVAERLLAGPGNKQYGALTVLVSAYGKVTSVVRAPPGAFLPAPRVESQVVKLVPLATPRIEPADAGHFAAVVHAAFGRRRKTLRNALRARWEEVEVEDALEQSGIHRERRGETLTLEEFCRLSHHLPTRCPSFPK